MTQTTRYGLIVLLVAVPACSRPSLKLAPVSGTVTYRGRGIANATVQLLPDTARGTHAPSATGQTGADGSFTLQTPPHGAGAVPGHYKVTIQHYHSAIPVKYGNPAQSHLAVEVPPAGLTSWKVELKD